MKIRFLSLLAGALLLAACPLASNHAPDASVRVTASADTIALGDSLHLTAYLLNPGDEPLRLEFETQCQVEMYVLAPDRTVVHPGGGGTTCISAPSTLAVPAGDSIRFREAWLAATPVLGAYTVYAVVSDHHVGSGEAREQLVTMRLKEQAETVLVGEFEVK